MDQSACNLQSLYVSIAAFSVAAFATFLSVSDYEVATVCNAEVD